MRRWPLQNVRSRSCPSFLLILAILLLVAACSDSSSETTDGDTDGDTSAPDGDTEDSPDGDTDGDIDGDADSETAPDGDAEEEQDAEPVNVLPFEPAGPDTAPDPMQPGPFPVGVRTYDLVDESRINNRTERPRWLRTEIWYPAAQAARGGEAYSYDLKEEADDPNIDLGEKKEDMMAVSIPPLPSQSYRDADIDTEHGPYPLVLFSHGSNGIRMQSVFFTEHLASHGYIVVSLDHENNTLWDIVRDGWNEVTVMGSFADRPEDMIFMLDDTLAKAADPESFIYGMIDEDNIGIAGHSFGALTSLVVPCLDSRVKVSVPQSPVINLAALHCGDLGEYPAPTFIMGGTKDNTLEYKDQYCQYNDIQGTEKYFLEVVDAGHFTFSNMCDLDLVYLAEELDFGDAANALNDGCSETENIDYQTAFSLINYYGMAFLNAKLRNSSGSMAYMVEKTEGDFSKVHFYVGDDKPDWPDGGCD